MRFNYSGVVFHCLYLGLERFINASTWIMGSPGGSANWQVVSQASRDQQPPDTAWREGEKLPSPPLFGFPLEADLRPACSICFTFLSHQSPFFFSGVFSLSLCLVSKPLFAGLFLGLPWCVSRSLFSLSFASLMHLVFLFSMSILAISYSLAFHYSPFHLTQWTGMGLWSIRQVWPGTCAVVRCLCHGQLCIRLQSIFQKLSYFPHPLRI